MKQILGLSFACCFSGSAYGPASAAPAAHSPKTRAHGWRTPTDEGSAVSRPSGLASLITVETGAINLRREFGLVEMSYPLSRKSRTPKSPRMMSPARAGFPADLLTPGHLAPHHRRRATATPNRNATNSEPSGASRAMLLKMLNGIPGFRPASIASPTRWTVPFTASETSAMVDFGSGTGSKPSWAKGASGMSSLTMYSPSQQATNQSKRELLRHGHL